MENPQKIIESVVQKVRPGSVIQLNAGTSLVDDLRLDSLDLTNFFFELEDQIGFEIPEAEIRAQQLVVIGNLCAYLASRASLTKDGVSSKLDF